MVIIVQFRVVNVLKATVQVGAMANVVGVMEDAIQKINAQVNAFIIYNNFSTYGISTNHQTLLKCPVT